GQDIGNGILRYGHYKNGALMGYVIIKVTEFGGNNRHQESLDILEKFTEHQRKNNKVITRSIEMYVDDTEMKNLSEDERQKRLKDLRDLSRKS
ncbi:hypothetical protein KJE99_005075, partial [Salmonella enterica]|nr:hypothetical protein [Salmonella enterica]